MTSPATFALDGWVIHLFGTAVNGSAVHQTYTTGTGGAPPGGYTFTVLPGTYTVCETLQTTWVQTFPIAGAGIADCDGPPNPDADNLTPGPLGYAVTLVSGQVEGANDFGNNTTTTVTCPEDPNRALLLTRTVKPGQGPGGSGVPGNPANYDTVQAAYNAARDSAVLQKEYIGLFSNTVENLLLDGSKDIYITQCTNAKVTAADNTKPVWDITSTGKLTIIGPDSYGGNIGWRLGGNGGDKLRLDPRLQRHRTSASRSSPTSTPCRSTRCPAAPSASASKAARTTSAAARSRATARAS